MWILRNSVENWNQHVNARVTHVTSVPWDKGIIIIIDDCFGETPVYSVTEAWLVNICVIALTNGAWASQRGGADLLYNLAQSNIS